MRFPKTALAMDRLDSAFRSIRRENRPAFVAYITAGDPTLRTTCAMVKAMAQSGCDVMELGVPFSDPLADGVVNQRAAARALSSGTTLAKILKSVASIRKTCSIPLVLFTYFNPVHRMGIETFAQRAQAAGVDGVLILDLPPEEALAIGKIFSVHALKMIYLVAPTSDEARIKKICRRADGFLYCVSRTGVTGAETANLAEVRNLVRRVKTHSRLPVVIGFGISSPAQAAAMGKIGDGVVIGSAIVSLIERYKEKAIGPVSRWVRRVRMALDA